MVRVTYKCMTFYGLYTILNYSDLRSSFVEHHLNMQRQSYPDESDPILMEFMPTHSYNKPITVHVIFEAADKPWTLMRILKSFKVSRLSMFTWMVNREYCKVWLISAHAY